MPAAPLELNCHHGPAQVRRLPRGLWRAARGTNVDLIGVAMPQLVTTSKNFLRNVVAVEDRYRHMLPNTLTTASNLSSRCTSIDGSKAVERK